VSNGTQTTINFKVTNNCRSTTRYVAIGTSTFTRVAPADGSIYAGNLGTYNVTWTTVNGNPGFVSMKFDPTFNGFNSGATEVFSIVVNGFNPNTTIQVQGKAGNSTDTLSFLLSTLCPPSSPTLATQPFADFTAWLSGSWTQFMNWLAPPETVVPATRDSANYFQPYTESGSDYFPALSHDGTLNWKWLKESSSQRSDK